MAQPGKSKLLAGLTFDRKRLAEIQEEEGDAAKAAKLYASVGAYRPAARLFAQVKDRAKAVEAAFKAVLGKKAAIDPDTTPLQAGELLASAAYHREAVALFELANAFELAAKSSFRLGDTAQAAQFYDRGRLWTKAATAYQKAGLPREALRALERESDRLKKAIADKRSPRLEHDLQRVERKRAELLGKIGRSKDAATLMREGGSTSGSARMMEQGGRYREAIDAYLEARQWDDALRLAESAPGITPQTRPDVMRAAGRHAQAAKLYAALGLDREAAESFEAAKEWLPAAERWRALNESLRAGRCLARGGRPADAATQFAAARDWLRAAKAYEVAEDPAAAVPCFQQAAMPLDAARCALAAGQHQAAATLFLEGDDQAHAAHALRQVARDAPTFVAANDQLVSLLYDEGMQEEALQRVRLFHVLPDPGGRERAYWEGRINADQGDNDRARQCFTLLAQHAPGYRDVDTRLAALPAPLATMAAPTHAAPAAAPYPPGVETATLSSEAETLEVGGRLADRYQILEELGQGGMGRVYRAHDEHLDEAVAIKTLLEIQAGSDAEARLLREVQICRKITHPNIVRVHDIGRFGGGVFVTMELLDGQALDALLSRHGRLSRRQVRAIVAQIANGLAEAHALGVVHRDLKPSNLILAAKRVKILDFGIAQMESMETRLTQTGHAVGSPHYMSPEQLKGEPIDARSDLYALGVLTFTLLTGREPFQGDNISTIAIGHLQNPPPDVRAFRPNISASWAQFIVTLLAKEPDDRYANAGTVLRELAKLELEGGPDDPSAAVTQRMGATKP